jgi:SAM-dependent methyltransferase
MPQNGEDSMETTQHRLVETIAGLELQSRERVLELGCGDGWACRLLAAQLPDGLVIGLDASDERVREARGKSTAFDNLLYLWSAAEQIPWQENFFTTVLCVDSAGNFQDLEKVFGEAHRVLAPGGSFWIINPAPLEGNEANPAPGSDSGRYLALLGAAGFESVALHGAGGVAASPPTSTGEPSAPAGGLVITARKPQ